MYVLTKIDFGDFDTPYPSVVGVTENKNLAKEWKNKHSRNGYQKVKVVSDLNDLFFKLSYTEE